MRRDCFYKIAPLAPVYDLMNLEKSPVYPMMDRQAEYKQFGEEPIPYEDDPWLVQPDMFHIEHENGQREIVREPGNHLILAIIWIPMDESSILCCSVEQIKPFN